MAWLTLGPPAAKVLASGLATAEGSVGVVEDPSKFFWTPRHSMKTRDTHYV